MKFARIRLWYLISIILGLVAIAADTTSKKHAAAAMMGMVNAIFARNDGVDADVLEEMKEQADVSAHRSGRFGMIGFCMVAGSVVCLLISNNKSEPGPRSMPLVVLIAYGALFLLVV